MRKSSAEAMVDYSDSTVVSSDKGQYALIDYTNALPRAKLYASWQTPTNGDALHTLASHEFDPQQSVLVSSDSTLSQPSSDSKADPGTVSIDDYLPKRIQMSADVKAPSILLFNDRTDPLSWLRVRGWPAKCDHASLQLYYAGRLISRQDIAMSSSASSLHSKHFASASAPLASVLRLPDFSL